MLTTTLEQGLRNYEIGDKARKLRLRKKMGLVELGEHTSLSPALLSKIERGRLFPTLPTLLRIAMVFGVGLEYFFAGAREEPLVALVRKNERIRFPEKQGAKESTYQFESLDYPAVERKLNSYYAEFSAPPAAPLRLHEHAGAEFIYALKGALTVQIGGTDYTLNAGDSLYFDSSVPHGYRRNGSRVCAALVVTTA